MDSAARENGHRFSPLPREGERFVLAAMAATILLRWGESLEGAK